MNLFAATSGAGIYMTTNNGSSWRSVSGVANGDVSSLAVSGSNLFAGASYQGGVYVSTNDGANWNISPTGMPTVDVGALAASGTKIFAGTSGGVFMSANSGTTWTEVNAGLKDSNVTTLAVIGSNIFGGTFGHGIWRRPLSEMSATRAEQPVMFKFNQNYPNPFNPSTEISFTLTERGMVQLDVFDMLGRKIETLVHTVMDAGPHSVKFEAVNLATGIYTAIFTTNGVRQKMKMLLSK